MSVGHDPKENEPAFFDGMRVQLSPKYFETYGGTYRKWQHPGTVVSLQKAHGWGKRVNGNAAGVIFDGNKTGIHVFYHIDFLEPLDEEARHTGTVNPDSECPECFYTESLTKIQAQS